MQLNSLLVNLLLTSLAAARYISSDPATCSKPPVKRGLRLHDGTPELDLTLDARSPMGRSSIQGRSTEKEACLRCCHAGTKMCDDKCEAPWHDGAGDLNNSKLTECKADCKSWNTRCVAKCG
ncbi:hypothetical protein E4U17_007388 [Claviceps sp. LM77 group G4]|nr:hypothetical protein E4U17_007388 [Claviceps sp. LM77 group G4]KAG6079835.1 hypothetical protein E4U16_000793 [Claviceps sp. LM84 group G4]KAG6080412.1 hypothetical protein E4U33_007668 [Claviceps sp. LM78 group G4]